MLIIDSIISPYRADYKGRSEIADRQQSICELLRFLQNLADTYQPAVVITSQMQSSPDPYYGQTDGHAGNIIAHGSTYRIQLKRSGMNRIARMIDSPCQAGSEVLFTLSESGIQDVDLRTL